MSGGVGGSMGGSHGAVSGGVVKKKGYTPEKKKALGQAVKGWIHDNKGKGKK